jgi:peptide deformylase
MAVLEIARMGAPVLRRVADPVDDIADSEIQRLINDMIETMRAADGVGLAAPQVGRSLRIVVFFVPPARDGGDEVPLTVLINPEIEALDASLADGYEGCLSLPGLIGSVPRLQRIAYRGIGRDGEAVLRIAEGFHARVVQHETDHLDGILYPQRMPDLGTFGFADEMRRAAAEA